MSPEKKEVVTIINGKRLRDITEDVTRSNVGFGGRINNNNRAPCYSSSGGGRHKSSNVVQKI